MRAIAIVALASACGARPNPAYCDHHPGDHQYCAWLDAAAQADTAADGSGLCIGEGAFALCVDSPTSPLTLSGDFDTDLAPSCAAVQPAMWKANAQPDACVVVGTTIMVTDVVAHGGRPLVLIASDTITVTGLDVSSRNGAATVGAGYDPTVCGPFALAPTIGNGQGGGGGAGGTFYGAVGGGGGQGANGNATGGTAGTAVAMPATLRGGCPGQDGAVGTTVAVAGGPGGGAMYLAAKTELDLTNATLQASGAGGNGGTHFGGGGGGGSGGMIVLFSGAIGASGATIIANGGGGGAGGASGSASPGSDPSKTTPTTPANGGPGSGGGGSGGNGFAGSNNAQPGLIGTSYGGGGGGGGGGYIQTNHVLASPMISPTPVML